MNDLPILDLEDLLDRVGGERDFAFEILQEFLDSVPGDIESLKAAISSGDVDDSSLKAHTLKGSAANLSAKALSETAKIIEIALRENDLETALGEIPNLEKELTQLEEHFASLGKA